MREIISTERLVVVFTARFVGLKFSPVDVGYLPKIQFDAFCQIVDLGNCIIKLGLGCSRSPMDSVGQPSSDSKTKFND